MRLGEYPCALSVFYMASVKVVVPGENGFCLRAPDHLDSTQRASCGLLAFYPRHSEGRHPNGDHSEPAPGIRRERLVLFGLKERSHDAIIEIGQSRCQLPKPNLDNTVSAVDLEEVSNGKQRIA